MKYVQCNLHSKFGEYKLRTLIINVAGIALRDQIDLVSIMVPLEVVADIININFMCFFLS